jgi:tetratricopeptide (TPR) repeat protein
MPRSVEILLCYAREDEVLRQGLEKHLRILQRQDIINIWHDRNISAGTEWEREIDNHLNSARVILLLVSPDFLDSDYCYGIEMKRAMERHEQEEACVIPIILRHVYWLKTPFGKLQALPTDGKPILSSSWYSPDEALYNAAEGIRIAVENIIATDESKQCVDRGNLFYDRQEYDKAISAYEQAIQYDSHNIQAYHNKGSALAALSRYEEAIAVYEQALHINPQKTETSKNLGYALKYLGRFKEALDVFKRALQISPQDQELKEITSALLTALEAEGESSKARALSVNTGRKA